MQRISHPQNRSRSEFQSSPDSKVGCNCSGCSSRSGWRTFQSSPDSKVGCNNQLLPLGVELKTFQSSPDSKVGCNIKDGTISGFSIGGFNPHPTRRSGATSAPCPGPPPNSSFNPHPTRRSGATQYRLSMQTEDAVSILTRLEGRVQPIG